MKTGALWSLTLLPGSRRCLSVVQARPGCGDFWGYVLGTVRTPLAESIQLSVPKVWIVCTKFSVDWWHLLKLEIHKWKGRMENKQNKHKWGLVIKYVYEGKSSEFNTEMKYCKIKTDHEPVGSAFYHQGRCFKWGVFVNSGHSSESASTWLRPDF